MLTMMRGASFVFLDPPAGGKNGFFSGAFLVDVTDPQKFMNIQMQLARSPLAQTSMDPDFKQTYTVAPDAVTIKNVHLSKISMKIALRDETPEHPIAPEKKLGSMLVCARG